MTEMTELHVHLDGSLRPRTVWKLAVRQGISLQAENLAELETMLTVPEQCKDLNQYLECFDLPLKVLQEPQAVTKAVSELVCDMAADGVTYGEIRFAPQLHTAKGFSQQEITQAAIQGLSRAGSLCWNFHGSLILCCMRGADTQAANEETLRTAAAFLGAGVCAVDLAGAEALYPTSDYASLFALARKLGLPFTIHAGEAAGSESIWDAIRFGAGRIGHGVRAVEDPKLCRYLADHRIPLEVCYTSNLQTHVFPESAIHPVRRLFDMGIHVTFSTDNRTVSHTTMRREARLLQERFGFTEDELNTMQQYAREALFSR